MRKRKKPDTKKPDTKRNAGEEKDSGSEAEFERQTQEQAELVPPARRPPTAVGAGTPPRPPRRSRPSPSAPEPHHRPALFRALQAVRAALGALLDVAGAASGAVTKGVQPRA